MENGITVHVQLYSQSMPILRRGVRNTYTKDGLFCVMMLDGRVYKYPVQHIFQVLEEADE